MFKLLAPRAPRALAALAMPAPAASALARAPRLFGRKPVVILGVVLALVIVDAGAAYGSVGDLGSSAQAGAAPLVAKQTTSGAVDVARDGSSHVSSVTVSVSSVVAAPRAAAGGCDATDFTIAHAVMPVDEWLSYADGQVAFTGATIQFNNKPSNQDQCKGAAVNLAYAIAREPS
jgi:hypothetical protein